MRIGFKSLLAGALSLISFSASAIEYYELEVYGYNLANPREIELEWGNSLSSDTGKDVANRIQRSSVEMNYGYNDHLELAGYLDYTSALDQVEYTAFRGHARTRFFEKGELPLDLGAYAEIELPRNFRQTDVGFEFRGIIEKDFSRWTVSLNPMLSVYHTSGDTDDVITGDSDEQTVTLVEKPKSWVLNWGLASSVAYNWSSKMRPHLDFHTSFTDQSALIIPGLDFSVGKVLKASVGAGFGMNDRTEQRLLLTRLEYEIN
jgi:hypothetical protein